MFKKIAQGLALAAVMTVLSTSAIAHPDDYKLRDRRPPYWGPGWTQGRSASAGDNGAPEGSENFVSSGIQLKSWISLFDFADLIGLPNIDNGNSCWGYVSPAGREYAIMGLSSGTAFVEVTDPANPIFAGHIAGPESLWRDVKTYNNHCYAVSEAGDGIQIISLSNIDAASNRVSLVNTVTGGGSMPTAATHTLFVNTASGYLYRCGGGSNGLRIYNLNPNPANPTFAGQWSNRYVHECQVLNYTTGPFAGKEIVFACSGLNGGFGDTGLDILDVTNKSNIINLYPPRIHWSNPGYSHQIWLSDDRRLAYINDELDEIQQNSNTRTIVVDVSFLVDSQETEPFVAGEFFGNTPAVGHNLYVKDELIFESNYTAGLQVFCTELDRIHPTLVGFFDTYPESDVNGFNGDWNNYPFLPSGIVLVSDIERGLFVLDVSQVGQRLNLAYPQGRPAMISPLGGTTMQVTIIPDPCGGVSVEPGTPTLHYNDGNGYVPLPMTFVSGSVWRATFPASTCGLVPRYYISAQNDVGTTFTDPPGAPSYFYTTVVASGEAVSFADSFESDTGWTTSFIDATTGFWQRGVPINDPGWAFDPAADSDGSGQCFLTQNTPGNTDVDNGSVMLESPIFDMTQPNAKISYDYYLRMDTATLGDRIQVTINNAGGVGGWNQVASHDNSSVNWRHHEIYATELAVMGVFVTPTMRLRFTATDVPPGNVVEGGIDAFEISGLECQTPVTCIKGDVSNDGLVDGADIQPFSEILINGAIQNTVEFCATDMDSDGLLEQAADLDLFVGCLVSDECP